MNRKDSPGILIDRATETAPQGPSAAALLDGRVLGDRRFRVVLSASGTGFSSFEGVALTRWSGDRVEDDGGLLVYLRDLDSGAVWSVGRQPMGWPADHCGVEWTPGAAILTSRNAGIEARMEVCVAPGAPAELRRITLKNLSDHARRLDLTTCTEPVLQDSAADEAHPAFSKLFIQTEAVPALAALLARRRPRANGENHPWLVHGLQGEGPLEWETDRARFLGRGRETSSALSLEAREGLSGTVGNVLDPVMCLRRPVRLAPGATVRFDVLLGAGSDREQSLQMVSKFGSHAAVDQAFDAAAGAAALVREIAVDREEELRLEHLAFALLAGHPGLRAGRAVLERIRHVPGPSPSPLVRAREIAVVVSFGARVDPDRAAETLRACRYWNALGVPAKPVWIADEFSPIEEDLASGAVRQERARLQRGEEDRLAAAAPLYLASNESLADAHRRVLERDRSAVPGMRLQAPQPGIEHGAEDDFFSEELRLFNGHGGFNPASNEYVIRMPLQRNGRLRLPPLPWVNVIANEDFGCLVSETGSGCTWSGNSREHRLTPWRNDPLRDPADEALYLRDEVTGEVWCPLPGPAPAAGPFEMRHGFGYSCCRHRRGTLDMETTIFVPRHHSAKVSILKITNRGAAARRLSITAWQRLCLGSTMAAGRNVVTRIASGGGTMLAGSAADPSGVGGTAFAAVSGPAGSVAASFSGDRESFLGVRGSAACPAALAVPGPLAGSVGAGLDPCFAAQLEFVVPAGESVECVSILGSADGEARALELAALLRAPGEAARALAEVRAFWEDLVGGVRVQTPSPALDPMINGWLTYQNLSCRVWGRTAFYQSGGAFGFRDQLQDCGALAMLRPDLTRAQLLLHAAHQFVEGDVMHWWHPPRSRGIRTRFADDLLWLPYIVTTYIRSTGDWGVLDEQARFLTGRMLAKGEDELFMEPSDSGERADIYEHCCRALDRSLETGSHGLPFFGTGDWNDGMNRVGREGRGESVWMGFFVFTILGEFAPVCDRRHDGARAEAYRAHREKLRAALNDGGWDGEWYRRAYYDDGTPLGSHLSDECQIDALAQAWAVLSGAAPAERAAQAMDSLERRLVSEDDGIIRLLTPAFAKTPHDPGYIKGYIPGVRENGGQYTHAAMWVVRALAELGRTERAAALLEMLSPVSHTGSPDQVATYQAEPYVIAADVYGEPPHVGRGGWTWYTGSAGWMFRVALESVLGVRMSGGDTLVLKPCVPHSWKEFRVSYRVPGSDTVYVIEYGNPLGRGSALQSVAVDSETLEISEGQARVPLQRDGRTHRVSVTLG